MVSSKWCMIFKLNFHFSHHACVDIRRRWRSNNQSEKINYFPSFFFLLLLSLSRTFSCSIRLMFFACCCSKAVGGMNFHSLNRLAVMFFILSERETGLRLAKSDAFKSKHIRYGEWRNWRYFRNNEKKKKKKHHQ